MATQLFFRSDFAVIHRGTNTLKLNGLASGWVPFSLSTSRGAGSVNTGGSTVAGTTNGIETTSAGLPIEWISEPVSADVTISGTITANLWASENNMSANVAINVIIDIIRANTFGADGSNEIVNIVKSTRTTEVAVTTNAVNNFTTGMVSGGYTAQTLNRGDRLRIRVFGDDAGTMAAGFTFQLGYNGPTAAADGDSYVTFTETFSFESAPSGTVIYLTDTASDVSTASIDREAWTSEGGGAVNDVTGNQVGWVAPIQVTDTQGGTVVDWFTKKLQAVTLTGLAQATIKGRESVSTANASLRCEIARVNSDGTSPTIWGSWCLSVDNGRTGELDPAAESEEIINISGDALAISDQQRLRIRLYIDDMPTDPMDSGTVTTYYNGSSPAGSGYSFITFPVTLTEFTAAVFIETRNPWPWLTAVSRAANW
jgi:hypothetical protein